MEQVCYTEKSYEVSRLLRTH